MNLSKIKMMFFDFDDTLLIHYREHRLDATGEAHRERLLRREKETKDGYRIFDEIGEPNDLIQHFLESCLDSLSIEAALIFTNDQKGLVI